MTPMLIWFLITTAVISKIHSIRLINEFGGVPPEYRGTMTLVTIQRFIWRQSHWLGSFIMWSFILGWLYLGASIFFGV